MSEGVTEGWHPDPFGRHAERFHDGSRWMPYVRDGESHALDEPDAVGSPAATVRPPPSAHPGSSDEPVARVLLDEPVLVLRDRGPGALDVLGADGVALGSVVVRRARGTVEVDVVERAPVLVVRSVGRRGEVLTVADGAGTVLGRIEVTTARDYQAVALVAADGLAVGAVQDTTVTDLLGREAASLTSSMLAGAVRHLRLDTEAQPLRALALAALLAVEPRPVGRGRRRGQRA